MCVVETIVMGEHQQSKLVDAKVGNIEMLMDGARF